MGGQHKRHQAQSSITQALIYIRVSSDEQEREGLSLPTQLADCRRYAAERGWAIQGEFQDVLKGTRDDRPQYQAMLSEVRRLRGEGSSVAVIVKWLHRLGRRVLESVRAREELKALGVVVHSTMEGGLVGDFLANIMASTAQYEVEQLGERVREVNHHIIASGWRPVGRCPWGYRWRDATDSERTSGAPKKVLEIDSVAAPFVGEAFQRVANGETVRAISRWAASLPADIRGGRSLSFDTVRRMLAAPVYVGQSEPDEHGRTHAGAWPALVDQAIWRRVQEHIAGHRMLPHQGTGRHLLTGLLRCPKCGSRMGGKNRKGGRTAQYVCIAKMLGANAGDQQCEVTAMTTAVDNAVLEDVSDLVDSLFANDARARAALRRAWDELRAPHGAAGGVARMRRLETAREQARKRLARAAIALVDGTLDKSAYDAARQEIESDLRAAEDELTKLQTEETQASSKLPEFDEVIGELEKWRTVMDASRTSTKRRILSTLVTIVKPVRVARGRYEAKIDWSPMGKALQRIISMTGASRQAA